jgi:hypothetical protein
VREVAAAPRRAGARAGLRRVPEERACLLDGDRVHWSPLHGDLSTPRPARARRSVGAAAPGRRGPSTRSRTTCTPTSTAPTSRSRWPPAGRAGAWPCSTTTRTSRVVQAEQGWPDAAAGRTGARRRGPGHDGQRLGRRGAVLSARGASRAPTCRRCAARRRCRGARTLALAAAVLHGLGRATRSSALRAAGRRAGWRAGVAAMLDRRLNCPQHRSAGRWFDAAAGAAGNLSLRQRRGRGRDRARTRPRTGWNPASRRGGRRRCRAPSLAHCDALVAALADDADRPRRRDASTWRWRGLVPRPRCRRRAAGVPYAAWRWPAAASSTAC